MYKTIYLDMNVFRAIEKYEKNSDYLHAKIKNLKKGKFDFPYSAAHLEEVAKLKNSNFYLKFIENISNKKSFIVGNMPKFIAEKYCKMFQQLLDSPYVSHKDKIVYKKCLTTQEHICLNQNDEGLSFSTRLQSENINVYYKRVIDDPDSTSTAENSNINSLGSRTSDSQKINNIPDYFETSENIRKKYKIRNQTLTNLSHTQIFRNEKFLTFFKNETFKNNPFFNSENIPKGDDLMNYHHLKESVIDEILKSFEIIGYSQEENNKDKTIRGFTHDISHAIYGSSANYFITNDKRFYKKLKALFCFLEIPCDVLNFEEFIEYDFTKTHKVLHLPYHQS